MAFTTVTGSNGVTSLVGTTGIDDATIVTLNEKFFVGGNTGNDTVFVSSGTGNFNISDIDVRMGGGNDGFVITNNLLNSLISMDGEVLGNDGNDVFNADLGGAGVNGIDIINSEIRGMDGQDTITIANLSNSIVNGNAGNDLIQTAAGVAVATSSIYGGQGIDTINTAFIGAANEVNGNKGNDVITVTGTTIASTFLNGGQGDDSVTLNSATIDGNTISGDKGNDTLVGSDAADDIMSGGDDNDILTGRNGGDTLSGGTGSNTFVYLDDSEASVSGSSGFDTITDFTVGALATGGDLIDFNGAATGFGGVLTVAAAGSSLAATLTAAIAGGPDIVADSVQRITITDQVSFAGSYLIQVNGGAAVDVSAVAFDAATSTVVKVNSFSGITTANIG